MELPFNRDVKSFRFLNKSWEMPIVNYLLVGNCDAGVWFATVKIRLKFKKGQKKGLARCTWSSQIYCSVSGQFSIAIDEHLFHSVSLCVLHLFCDVVHGSVLQASAGATLCRAWRVLIPDFLCRQEMFKEFMFVLAVWFVSFAWQ